MFDNLKSRLGFSDAIPAIDEDDEYGGGYAEFEEYGAGYQADAGTASSVPNEPYAPVTTRPAYARRTSGPSSPALVSIEDVRARTQLPDSLQRDPLPPRHVTSARSGYRGDRTMVETANPAHPSTPNGRAAAAAASQERVEGFGAVLGTDDGSRGIGGTGSQTSASARGYDPHDAYAGRANGTHLPSRSVRVLRPREYGDVESVAKTIKAGDVVVLVLNATPEALAKRILDFSFGVASALDATVDCAAPKVFTITRNGPLTIIEKTSLKNQGIAL